MTPIPTFISNKNESAEAQKEVRMITDLQIENAIKRASKELRNYQGVHQHPDCIRFAYEWLDAQVKRNTPNVRAYMPLKHMVEKWSGRYVSTSDVQIAAMVHPEIIGHYPNYNISSRLVEPDVRRINHSPEAFTHFYREDHDPNAYKSREVPGTYSHRTQ